MTLKVFDVNDILIKELVNSNQQAGTYHVKFTDEKSFSTAYYYYVLNVDGVSLIKKMLMIK